MNFRRRILSFTGAAATAIALVAALESARAVEKRYWELSPYTVQVELAVNEGISSDQIAEYLRERIFRTLHPLWTTRVDVTTGARRHELLEGLDPLERAPVPDGAEFDKRLVLSVTQCAAGYTLACREWDDYARRWGPVLRREVRQQLLLPEQCFDLLRETFAPLAKVRSAPEDETRVTLVFKGSELPRRTDEAAFGEVGEVYLPLLIRFDHTGAVLPDGITEVPWTYLTLEQSDARQWTAAVDTGIRRPFGVRRRGRSEHLAISLRSPPGPTRVRFHARHDPAQGLSGYEVFRRLPDSTESQPLGLTDAHGSIVVEPTGAPIVTLYLRSDGQVLAKVPVAPGVKPLVEVPIADDSARLRAQAELSAVREQLIDIVARRAILAARIRARLGEGRVDDAKELLTVLDDLPGRAQFDQMITTAERNPQNKSTDVRIQQRIEKMFADTRALLGRFLDVRQVSELRGEVSAAARGAKE